MLNLIIHNQSEEQKKQVEEIAVLNKKALEEAKAGEACYADSQGWLDTAEWAGEKHLQRLEALAKEIRENTDAFVLIGVGGSDNAARSVIEALREDGAPEIIYAEIKKRLPDFTMDYDVDPVKKAIAESWPNSLDDTCAREEWGWKPEWDLSSMTDDMLEVIRKKNLK